MAWRPIKGASGGEGYHLINESNEKQVQTIDGKVYRNNAYIYIHMTSMKMQQIHNKYALRSCM